jgi:hypothetical protein
MQGMNARECIQWSDDDDDLLASLTGPAYIEDGIKVDISVGKVDVSLLPSGLCSKKQPCWMAVAMTC